MSGKGNSVIMAWVESPVFGSLGCIAWRLGIEYRIFACGFFKNESGMLSKMADIIPNSNLQ